TEKKDKIEAHNKADNMIYLAEKTLKDAGDKAKPEDKTAIEEKVKALKEILETGSKEDLETKTSELSDLVQKVSASMYQNPPSGGAEGAPADAAAGASGAEENGEKKPDDKGKAEEGEVVS
ncbi:MAG: Hsp70 family protein, partial [Patescibacteria group bacterium]